MCTATNLLRQVTLNIYSRIQLKLIYSIKATENEDVLKGKVKESRGFLKSGPTFPKSVPAVPPSAVAPREHSKLSVFTLGYFGIWGCAGLTAQHPVVHKGTLPSPVASSTHILRFPQPLITPLVGD